MATLDITTNASNRQEFTKTIQITKQQNSTIRLDTQERYVDKDILLTLNVRGATGTIGGTATAGSATAAISNVNSMATITNLTGKTAGTDYWAVKATATGTAGSYTPKYTITQSGWIESTVTAATAASVGVNGDSTGQTIYIPKATFKQNNAQVLVNTAGYVKVDDQVPIFTMPTITPTFDGGALNNKGATVTGTNVTLNDSSNTSGIVIQAKGSAGRDSVLYNGSAQGYINIADNTVANGMSTLAASEWNGTTYYLTGVELTAGKTFSITVPNGNATDKITFVFAVDNNYNVTVDSN